MASKLSDCYVFKSRLQEYAQKVGFTTPVYETLKEGPSHEPSFHSTVIVNGVRYDSLTGFFNRKAAEQSAAEIALTKLAKSGELKQSITQPVHETGLCKNLLQEYAQKMNYAIPSYECQGRAPHFSCTVEIGGIRYIGAAAKSKKEAEIKAARTALLAIQSSSTLLDEKTDEESSYTVIPSKRKQPETEVAVKQTVGAPKRKKKPRFEKKPLRWRRYGSKARQKLVGNPGALDSNLGNPLSSEHQSTISDLQLSHGILAENAGVLDNNAGCEIPSGQLESRVSNAILSDQIQVEGTSDCKVGYQFGSEQKECSVSDVQLSNQIGAAATHGVIDNNAAYQVASVQKETTTSNIQLPDQYWFSDNTGNHVAMEHHQSSMPYAELLDHETIS